MKYWQPWTGKCYITGNSTRMTVFLINVGDDDFSRLLPKAVDHSPQDPNRVKIMAFPPLGIQTLAPVLRLHGHQVRMFDTCHPGDESGAPGAGGRQ